MLSLRWRIGLPEVKVLGETWLIHSIELFIVKSKVLFNKLSVIRSAIAIHQVLVSEIRCDPFRVDCLTHLTPCHAMSLIF